jgi:hypothetical protein
MSNITFNEEQVEYLHNTTQSYRCGFPTVMFDDDRLTNRDILLYALLESFMFKTGKCFPKNNTLGGKMKCSSVSVSRSISNLKNCGWIETSLIYHKDSKQVKYRMIIFPRETYADIKTVVAKKKPVVKYKTPQEREASRKGYEYNKYMDG